MAIPYAPDSRYVSPYANTLADLMMRGGQARADALRRQGDTSSQMWQNIGQSISGTLGSLAKQYQDAPMNAAKVADIQSQVGERNSTTAERNQQTQARTQLTADSNTIGRILSTGGDLNAIRQQLQGTPDARLLPQIEKSFEDAAKRKADFDKIVSETNKANADTEEAHAKVMTSHADYLGGISADIAKHNYDPTAFFHGVALAHKDGMIDDQTAGQAIALGIQTPDQIKPFVDARIAASPEQQKLTEAAAARAATQADKNADNVRLDAQAKETARHNLVMEARPVAGTATAGALTDDGVEFAATQYRLTGKMPALGNGAGDVKAKIISNAAAQAKALGQTPVASIQKQAAYAGDAKALAKMQGMSAAASAFESKASQQVEIVRDLSNKVGRTQFPLINQAIVAGKADILGDTNAQQFYNAISTFSTEYAKIMEGSTGSAAGSSDSARAAAQRLISAKLNKGTLSDTLDLMQREMNLTLQGYDATIAHITERMGGAPAAPVVPTAQPGPGRAGGAAPTTTKIGRFDVQVSP